MMKLEELFSGHWQVRRTHNEKPFFQGQAEFKPCSSRHILHYKEIGTVTHQGGFMGEAFREYYFLLKKDGFDVFFDADLKDLFNQVTLTQDDTAMIGKSEHLCIADLYKSSYELISLNEWHWSHQVNGPKKDYSLHAIYLRD